jgi:hypothetical protein
VGKRVLAHDRKIVSSANVPTARTAEVTEKSCWVTPCCEKPCVSNIRK